MSKQNDWKQLAQDDIEEYELRQNAKPHWLESVVKVIFGVMCVGSIVLLWWFGIEIDKVYMEWQINR